MQKIGIRSHHFRAPTRIAVEASWDVIRQHDLDTDTGEHFDHIDGVISIEMIDGDSRATIVRISTVRTHEAWKRGEPNAGRAVYDFPRETLENIWA